MAASSTSAGAAAPAAPGGSAGMLALLRELFPLCRSITGDGVRQTLRVIGRQLPLEVTEVPTGTRVFDWTVPQEWNIRDAYVKDSAGRRVIDFQQCNLHVMGYSEPVHARMSLAELRPRLHSLPGQPGLVPFRTSYFRRDWAFSIAHDVLQTLEEGEYEVRIDSTLADGHLTFGEVYLPGASEDEVLISTHVCHPSLANDNLSGIAVATALATALKDRPRRLSYRFLFVPAQIGSLAWLSLNQARLGRIRHGLVLVAIGDRGDSTYKKSWHGDATIDRAALHVLKHSGARFRTLEFFPHGNDERQYSAPAFRLPVGALMRTQCGKYPEYHTSGDNLDFVDGAMLEDSLAKVLGIVSILEGDRKYRNLSPHGEPQLGRRGLYRLTGDATGGGKVKEMPILWVLNMSDGAHSLLDIAERADLPFQDIRAAADALLACGLLEEVNP